MVRLKQLFKHIPLSLSLSHCVLLSERQARMTLITVLISCTQDNAWLPIAAVALVWCFCQFNIYVCTCVCLLYLLCYCSDDDATNINCPLHASRCFLLLPQQTVALYLADRKYSYIIYLHKHTCTHVFMYLAEWIHHSEAHAHGQIYAESWVREYSKRICHNFRRSGIFSKLGIQIAVSSAKKMKSDE